MIFKEFLNMGPNISCGNSEFHMDPLDTALILEYGKSVNDAMGFEREHKWAFGDTVSALANEEVLDIVSRVT